MAQKCRLDLQLVFVMFDVKWQREKFKDLSLYAHSIISSSKRNLFSSNRSTLKEINPEYSLEGLMLRLKLQYFGHLMRRADSGKYPDAGKDWRQEEKGMIEDEMVGWHHWFNGHEFEQASGDGEGKGSLACCSPWGCKESDTTEQLNWSEYDSIIRWLF